MSPSTYHEINREEIFPQASTCSTDGCGFAKAFFLIVFLAAMIGGAFAMLPNDPTPPPYEESRNSIVRFVDNEGKTRASGVVIDEERGLILTNAHVTEQTERVGDVRVYSYEGEKSPFDVVWQSPRYDLALVDARYDLDGLKAVRLAEESPEVGEKVYAIGHPLGQLYRVTYGQVSAEVNTIIFPELNGSLPVDLQMAPGNSGGGLFNENGELVAIPNVLKFQPVGMMGGIAFPYSYAVPIENIRLALNIR